MNKKDVFQAVLEGKIDNKNYKKFKLSKSQFYKVYSRILFYQKLTDPIKLMVLNLSQKEFLACRDSKLKTELPSKRQFESFSMDSRKQVKDEGETV